MYKKYMKEILRSDLFKTVSEKETEETLELLDARVEDFEKNKVIRAEGEPIKDFGIVLKGTIMQIRNKQSGERAIFESMTEGQLFGEIIIFTPHRPVWPSDTVAKTDCRILFLQKEKLMWQIASGKCMHRVYLNLIFSICRRAENLMIALRCAKTRTLRQQVAAYIYEMGLLKDSKHMTFVFNRSELADYLYIPSPSLSRELAGMKKDGIIDYYKSSIVIIDKKALMDLL